MNAQPRNEDELHAYVDGFLDGDRRVAVERWLAEDAEAARRVADYRAQAALLHEMFDPVLREPVGPGVEELRQKLAGRMAGNDNRPVWHARPWVRAAAAVVLVIGGAVGGYFGNVALAPSEPRAVAQRPPLQTFAEEATQAHSFYTADERFQVEMGAEDQGALDSWLSQRLGRNVVGPDLAKVGWRLIGGRSLPTSVGATAQYMYVNDQGKRITLFVGAPQAGQEDKFSFAQRGDVSAFYWVEGGLAYALIGRLSRDELMSVTRVVYDDVKAGVRAKARPQPQPAMPPQQPQPQHEQQNPVQPVSETHKAKDS